MMLIGKPYQDPPPKFQPGDLVNFRNFEGDDDYEPGVHIVRVSDHCFTWLEGRRFGISNWRLRRVHKACQKSTEKIPKRTSEDCVTIDSKKLRASEKPLKDTRP